MLWQEKKNLIPFTQMHKNPEKDFLLLDYSLEQEIVFDSFPTSGKRDSHKPIIES